MDEAVDVKRSDGPVARVAQAGEAADQATEPLREVEIQLYAKRKEIYPRQRIGDTLGRFQKWRWLLVWATQVVFYGLPWLQWNGRQALLFDLASRKFYLFGLVLWPQDIIYLTAILIIAALTLGLAPFVPEPHLWEKLKMLAAGTLTRPLDIFDLFWHAAPWLLLAAKLVRMATTR